MADDILIHPKTLPYLRSGKIQKGGQDIGETRVPNALLAEALELFARLLFCVEDPGTRARMQLLCKKLDGTLK
jgi:hypothetical protein